ncbi:hypothetical protein HFK87_22170 [Ralstonia pseudosolanacearum]|nr:hypothetical protein [Ralstonia pseudosolanacearum]
MDDLITAIEGDLNNELSTLRNTSLGEPIDPGIAARLTTHLMLRTAYVRSTFEQAVTQIFDGTISLFTDGGIVREHLGVDELSGTAAIDEAIEDALRALPLDAQSFPRPLARRVLRFMARERFELFYEEYRPIITQVLTEMTKKIATNVRDAHNKALKTAEQSRWEEELMELSWQTQAVVGAALPDCIVLAREKGQDFTPLLLSDREKVELVVLPLSHDRLLIGSRGVSSPISGDFLNAASAACSSNFFISQRACDGAAYSDLIGQRSANAIRASVTDALSAFQPNHNADSNEQPTEPRISETEAAISLSFSLTCLDFATPEMAEKLGKIVSIIVRETGRSFAIRTLDGMTFALDFPAALKGLDRGSPAMDIIQPQPREYGRAVARAVEVVRDGELKTHIVMSSIIADWLLSDNEDSHAQAIHVIVSMLAELSHATHYEAPLKSLPVIPPDEISKMLHTAVSAAPSRYYCARESAFADPKAGERYAQLVKDSLAVAQKTIGTARLSYRVSGDLDGLLRTALRQISFVLGHSAEWLGHRDGLPDQDAFPGSSLPEELIAHGLDLWLELFARDLRNLYDADDQFNCENILALDRHVERLLWTVQICPWPTKDGAPYVSVPFGDDLALLNPGPAGAD